MKLTCALFASLLLAPLGTIFAAEAARPNIVFIFADDWGWGDLSCHGNTWLKTPHLDRLAGEGIDFQQFNVLSPVCSPQSHSGNDGAFSVPLRDQYGIRWPQSSGDAGLVGSQGTHDSPVSQSGGLSHGSFWKLVFRDRNSDDGGLRATHVVVDAHWKLLVSPKHDHIELYDLQQDPLEKSDLSQSHPDVVTQLRQKLDAWHATLPARPSGNVFSKERTE